MVKKIVIIYGPPCAGKTTYAQREMTDMDVVYDFDALTRAMSCNPLHMRADHPAKVIARKLRKTFLDALNECPESSTAYVLCLWPMDWMVRRLFYRSAAVEFLPLCPDHATCMARLDGDTQRPDKDAWAELIDQWFAEHDGEAFQCRF